MVCIFQLFLLPTALVAAWPGGPHQLICPIRLILQEDFLLCMHKRMEDILHEAEAIADIMAPGVAPGSLQGQLLLLLVSHAHTCEYPTQRFAAKLEPVLCFTPAR